MNDPDRIPASLRILMAVLVFTAPRLMAVETVAADGGAKAPFRLLYSNDLTNIMSCPSPFFSPGKPFDESLLRASVDETADTGIQVHMLQPGLGWVPWWQSRIYPMSEHLAFLARTGQKPNSFDLFVAHGGDVIKVFVDECRAKGLVPFISMRMNDVHHIFRGSKEPDPAKREKAMSEFKYFADHPDYRLGPDYPDKRMQYAFDWAHPEVRDYKLSLIREICENYDIDGLELDFMRSYNYFNPKHTTPGERRAIMADFVRKVRDVLDNSAKPGRHRWLCVRIPGYPSMYDQEGIDLKAFAAAGVDMVNASGYYFTDQQMEMAEIRRQLPARVALYDEVHYVTAIGAALSSPTRGNLSPVIYRRTTGEQFNTTAHLAYARGADGLSTFNFQYYRGTTNKNDVEGPPSEPPFAIFKHLADPDWLARQPQDYFAGYAWDSPHRAERPFYQHPSKPGEPQEIDLDMAPPAGGWKVNGHLRIQGRATLGNSQWKATLNGAELAATQDVSEPYPNPYPLALGTPEDYRAFLVPASLLHDGINRIIVTMTRGAPVQLIFMDVAMPSASHGNR